jgi:transposase
MNERLDDLRRELVREAHDEKAKQAIKGLRWLLLHRRDNLEKDAARRLKRSLALNEPLQCAYLLKEELAELWHDFLKLRLYALHEAKFRFIG